MSYNFLGLVNDINNKMNEVPLTENNFNNAAGFYSDAKNAVNSALNDINRVAWQWPFNHVTKNLTLVVDQVRYDWEDNTKTINWNTFRIQGDNSLNVRTTGLIPMDYEDYLMEYSDMEYNPSNHHKVPENVFRCPDLTFGVIPPPDKAYTLTYEYYSIPDELENYDDVPTVPKFFRGVIRDGSYAQAFRFRGDIEMATSYEQKFLKGIEEMRTIFINRTDYINSTMFRRK